MIEVEVERYCQNCEDFEPRCYTGVSYKYNKSGNMERTVRTTIYCRHRERCREIHEDILMRAKENIKKEETEDE